MKNFKLTIFPAFDASMTLSKEYKFYSKSEMMAASNCAADLLLFVQDNNLMPDYSNMFVYTEFVDGAWEEMEED